MSPSSSQIEATPSQNTTQSPQDVDGMRNAFQQIAFLQQYHQLIGNAAAVAPLVAPVAIPPPIVTPIGSSAKGGREMFSIDALLNMAASEQSTPPPDETPAPPPPPPIVQATNATIIQLPANLELSATDVANIIQAISAATSRATPQLANVTLSPAASTTSSSRNVDADDDDDDGDLFVDVESIEVAIDGKDRRKAHVEFYRKMKAMRQRERTLTCARCNKKVDNIENSIQTHVSEHADAGGYQCRLCGWQSNDKYRIYDHMRTSHPTKIDKFADKRDMPKMCETLAECFPRVNVRPRKEIDKGPEKYLAEILQETSQLHQRERQCAICRASVRTEKGAMIRHVQGAHTLKCKTCKVILTSIDEQLTHQKEKHDQRDPKMSVHYAPSAALACLQPSLEKCFPRGFQIIP
ncbi:unnamed protein product [Caenorhabditis bovis]|uniref:C2H2-type domain-containing protein n=1 Tax=Caenorhabditis bovis TaxID=2654633 RepID=A0A8S1EZA7_9PELO|nr:unnamed protein product [Caenorhabditis bovis]